VDVVDESPYKTDIKANIKFPADLSDR